jgi:hypothetical protein
MKDACAKLHDELIKNGYKSEIYKEGFIIIENPTTEKKHYVRFQKNRALVSIMTEIKEILSDKYSPEDLAFAISKMTPFNNKDGIRIDIKEGLLAASSLVSIGWFTTVKGLYHRIYETMLNCDVAVSLIIDELEFNKKWAFLRTRASSENTRKADA